MQVLRRSSIDTLYSDHEGPAIAPVNESSLVAEGAVTRPTGRRKPSTSIPWPIDHD